MKKNLEEPLWTFIWAANRYFVGSSTIAASTFPEYVIRDYIDFLSDTQKGLLARDIYEHYKTFQSDDETHRLWLKFAGLLDTEKHFFLEIQGKRYKVFEANGKTYPVEEYSKNPHFDTYVPQEILDKEDTKRVDD